MRRPDRALFAGEGSATAAPAAAVGVAPFGEATQTWGPVASSSQTRSYRTSERIWYEVGERWCKRDNASEPECCRLYRDPRRS